MVLRSIEIDEDTDRLLADLAAEYQGDLSRALSDLVHAREGLDSFAERTESANEVALSALRSQAEEDFRNGRAVNWDELKARHNL
jgi:hypothetical protein